MSSIDWLSEEKYNLMKEKYMPKKKKKVKKKKKKAKKKKKRQMFLTWHLLAICVVIAIAFGIGFSVARVLNDRKNN